MPFFYIEPHINPYMFELLKSDRIADTQQKRFKVFHYDLNHDGYPEEIVYSFESLIGFSLIVVEKWNGEIIDQFNFRGKFPDIFKPLIFDINKDGVDDILMCDIVRDSLYLNAIDVFNKTFLFKGVFITEKPESVKTDFWNLYVLNGEMTDVNSDGEKDFLLTVNSGYSHYPRGLFAFDLKSLKIIKKFEYGFGCIGIHLFDVNEDGENEILLSNSASDNLKYRTGYHDKVVWNIILDKNFNVLSKDESFGGFTSQLNYQIVNDKLYAFFSWHSQGKDSSGIVFRVNKDYSLSEVLRLIHNWNLTVQRDNKSHFVFLNSFADSMYIYDDGFSKIREFGFDDKLLKYLHLSCDIDGDKNEEFCLFKQNSVVIYNQNFSLMAELTLEDDDHFVSESDQLIKIHGKNYFFCRTHKYSLRYEIVPNPYYGYFYLLFLLGVISIYVILFILYRFLLFFLVYLKYFIHSFRKTNTGLVLLDSLGRIYYSNEQLYDFLRLQKPKYKKALALDVFREKTEIYETISKSISDNHPCTSEFYYSSADYQLNGSVTVTPFNLFSRIAIGYLIEVENFTEAIIFERTKIWSKSVQRIAHDIKTPLSSVNIGIQTIREALEKNNSLDKELSEDFDRVINQLTKIRSLTKSFLQFINMELINFQIISPHQVIDETLEKFNQFFKKTEVTIIKEYTSDNILIWGDPFQLNQVFQIFIENAIDAISGFGEVIIKTEIDKNENTVKINISDNGCGIKFDIQDKLFSPYLTTKKDGTGIGLFIAKKIVEDHNGRISFSSVPDEGSTFSLDFPNMDNSLNKNSKYPR